jgi:hypothetical protein
MGASFNDFSYLTNPSVMNGTGELAFVKTLTGGVGGVSGLNDSGIWSESGGTLHLVIREGDQASGTGGAAFESFSNPVLNDAGQTALRGMLRLNSAPGVNEHSDSGIWAERAGDLTRIAREGSQAPGTATGSLFGPFDDPTINNPVINNAGHTAFLAKLRVGTGDVVLLTDAGIWSEGRGSLSLVARAGSQAPGTPIDSKFSFFRPPVINGEGHTAFWAAMQLGSGGVDTTNNQGIWAENADELQLVVRRGASAPGAPGAVFDAFSPPSINADGQIVFSGALRDGLGGVSDANDIGIWAQDRGGVMRLIVREGSLLDVDDGPLEDLRTVQSLLINLESGNQDGRPSGFNDDGLIAFRAVFTDGTAGVFVASHAAVPEPGAIGLIAIAVLAILTNRARRA